MSNRRRVAPKPPTSAIGFCRLADEGALATQWPELYRTFRAVEQTFKDLREEKGAEMRAFAMWFAFRIRTNYESSQQAAFRKKALEDFARAARDLVDVMRRAGSSDSTGIGLEIIFALKDQAETEKYPEWWQERINEILGDGVYWHWVVDAAKRAACRLAPPSHRFPRRQPAALLEVASAAWRAAGKRPGRSRAAGGGPLTGPFVTFVRELFQAVGLEPPSEWKIANAVRAK